MTTPWTVQLCRQGVVVATCSAHQFMATALRNEAGAFTLDTSAAGVPAAGYVDPDDPGGDLVPFDGRDVETVRLVGEGRILFEGAVAGEDGGFWSDQDATGERWRFTGVEAGWHLLAGRLAYPDPTAAPPWGDGYDTRVGVSSTVLAEYIDANMGATALAEREVPGVEVADEIVGSFLTFDARLQTLAALSTRLARTGGFEVIPEHDFDGTTTYRLTASRDKSSLVVFSDQGDLSELSARFTRRSASFVLSAGTGQLASRTFRTAGTGATGADRFEILSDQSSMDSASSLAADASARLALAGEQFSIASTLATSLTEAALNADLRLGDRVAINVRGRRYAVPIEAVSYEVTPERQIMTPRFGVAQPNELSALLRKVADLSMQIDVNVG